MYYDTHTALGMFCGPGTTRIFSLCASSLGNDRGLVNVCLQILGRYLYLMNGYGAPGQKILILRKNSSVLLDERRLLRLFYIVVVMLDICWCFLQLDFEDINETHLYLYPVDRVQH